MAVGSAQALEKGLRGLGLLRSGSAKALESDLSDEDEELEALGEAL